MGSDDLHHRRKAKSATHLKRRKAVRGPYEKVLVVCEGEKTEPNYFAELRRHYELSTANIEIDGSCGSSPANVCNYGIEFYNRELKNGDAFDRVYLVFDKDSHSTFTSTLQRIKNLKPKGVFYSAYSVPCFEYWLLLHHTFSTKPYRATRKMSVGEQVLKDLMAYMPHYAKGAEDIFTVLLAKLDLAVTNSDRALKQSVENQTDNPSTTVHELIQYLQNLKQKKN